MRNGLGGALYFLLCFLALVHPGLLQELDILDSEVKYLHAQTKGVVTQSVILDCGPTLPSWYIWSYTDPGTVYIKAVVFNFDEGPKLQSLAKTLGDINVITNTASLVIKNLSLAAQGLYTCQAFYKTVHGVRAVYYYVKLTVMVPVSKPYILLSDSSPVEGTETSMRCGLDNGTSPISYRWVHESKDGINTTFAEHSMNLFNISTISRNHSGWYWCWATNEVSSQLSDRIWLNIIFGPDVPRIEIAPYSVTDRGYSAVERATVSLTCQASSNPVSQYIWFYNNSQVHSGQQYNITKILRMHSGLYSCVARNYYLNTLSKTSITLYVYYPPAGSPNCTIFPANNYTDMALWCSWEGGYPPASLYWSSPLLLGPNGTDPSLSNTTLVQRGSRTPYNSTFTCYGSHVVLPTSFSCRTTAMLPPAGPWCYANTTWDNQFVKLSCSWEGSYPWALLWWTSNNGSLLGSLEENTNVMVLRSSATYSGKTFVCHAKHPLSPGSKQCTVRLEAPVLETQRSLVSVYEGNDVQLSCILKANNLVTEIIWFNNQKKQVGAVASKYLLHREATWSSLTVREVDRLQDSGQYWCSANNAVGGVEIPITVFVKRYPVPPNVTITWIKYSSHQRTEVNLKWTIKETGNLTGFVVEQLRSRGPLHLVNETFTWVQRVVGIQPDIRNYKLVGLDPTSAYAFRMLAVNHRTMGYPSKVKTPANPPFNAYPAVISAAIGGMIATMVGTMLLFLCLVRNRNRNPWLQQMLFGMQHSQSRENINSPEDETVSRSQSEGELEDPAVSSKPGPSVMSAEQPAATGEDNEPVNVIITVTATT